MNTTLTTKSRMFTNRTGFLIRGNKVDKKKSQEQYDLNFADSDKDTIELSIAASEALVISEIVKGDTASFPAASIVDIALCVKQARNNLCSDGLDCSCFVAVEVDENDSLSDLNEDDMADAFEDVGLSTAQLDPMCCSSSVKKRCSSLKTFSHVLETPLTENQYGCDGEAQYVDSRPQMFDYNDIYSENKLEDALAMSSNVSKCSPGYVPQQKLQSDSSLALKTHYHQSIHKNLSTLEIPEGVKAIMDSQVNATKVVPKFFIEETSFFSESADVVRAENLVAPMPGFLSQVASLSSVAYDGFCGTGNSVRIEVSQSTCSSDSSADPLCSVVPCTISQANIDVITTNQKVVKNGAAMDSEVNTTKAVPKFFTGETSFFSESADVVRDKNSVAPKPGFLSQIASLSSIAYGGFCGTTNSERIEFSQNICSGNSLADPLCSVVPCTISQTNIDLSTTSQKFVENGAGKNCYTQLGSENLLPCARMLNCKSLHGEDVLLNNVEDSTVTCHRRLASLKTYSTLGLSLAANSGEIVDCFKPSLVKDPAKILFSESSVCEYCGKDHDGPAIAKPTLRWPESKGHKLTGVVNVESTATEITRLKNLTGFDSQRKISSISPYHTTQNLNGHEDPGPARKKVRFSEAEIIFGESQKLQPGHEMRSSITRQRRRSKGSSLLSGSRCEEVNTCLSTWEIMDKTKMIFQGLKFLLTGFTSQRQSKLVKLISKHGGSVLSEVPSPSRRMEGSKCKHGPLPIVISSRKSQTTKFLYGCAVNAFLLKVDWLIDSVAAGSVLPPQKYMIFSHHSRSKFASIGWPICCSNKTWIFDGVGIMLHGRPGFCNKFAKVIKHGGGHLFKTLQWLIESLKTGSISLGAIVAEDEGRASRHLRQCASEQRLQMMPVSWIVNSLHLGHLLTIEEKHPFSSPPKIKFPELFWALEQGE